MSGVTNTGVVNYISNPVASFPKNSITIDIFGNTFYRNYEFGAGDDTGVYWNDKQNYSEKVMLFIATAINNSLEGKFSYGKKLRSSQSLDFTISLPTKNNAIDFEFMENFIAELEAERIKELEAERIKELEAYLEAARLKDTVLTEEEEVALCEEVCWGEYKIGDLFIKKTVRGVPKNEENLDPNPDGFYMYGQNIKRQYEYKILCDKKYLQKIEREHPILAYTSSVGEIGLIAESFYRSGNNGAFQGLYSKERKFSLKELQFILTSAKIHFKKFNYDTSMSDIINLVILLPTKNNAIDFDYMERFISAVQKLIIKGVVEYSEKKIAAYKKALEM